MKTEQEDILKKRNAWKASRPYRIAGELVFYSIVCLGLLVFILSKTSDQKGYIFLDIQPIYWVGLLAGGLGGCARGLVDFWRRTSYDLDKLDYWKHALPFYIGVLFGFLMVLVIQTTFSVFGVEQSGAESGGLSFLAMVCMLAGLFTDRTESLLLQRYREYSEKNQS